MSRLKQPMRGKRCSLRCRVPYINILCSGSADEESGKKRCEEHRRGLSYNHWLYVDFHHWPGTTYNPGRIIYHKFPGKALSCCKVEEDEILQSLCNQY